MAAIPSNDAGESAGQDEILDNVVVDDVDK